MPNQLWECDLIGIIPNSNGENYFIFVAIDHYSKSPETKFLKSKSAEEIVDAVHELIIVKHGIPERILSDNRLEFANRNIELLAKEYSFNWEYNSPYHRNTVGAVERANQTLMMKLKKVN